MEEKNLVVLPDKVADYLESMKEKNYTLIGAFKRTNATEEEKELMTDFFITTNNQEKFALAWVNGYKRKEKFYLVKFKGFSDVYCYLNYDKEDKMFSLKDMREARGFKTKFTKTFLKENGFGWVLNCEGTIIEEVEE